MSTNPLVDTSIAVARRAPSSRQATSGGRRPHRALTRRAGRDPGQITVTTLLPAAVGETRREALDALRPGLAFYAGFFPRYNRMMAEHGFVEEAAAIAAAWSRGDREAAERAVSDELIMLPALPERLRNVVNASRRIDGQGSMCRSSVLSRAAPEPWPSSRH